MTTTPNNWMLPVTEILNEVLRENLSTVIIEMDEVRTQAVIDFLLQLRHNTRWMFATNMSLQKLWGDMEGSQDVMDIMINTTNNVWLRLQTLVGFPFDDFIKNLAKSIVITRKTTKKGSFLASTKDDNVIADMEHRTRGLSEEEWIDIFDKDPWVWVAYLVHACHIDAGVLVASYIPKKRGQGGDRGSANTR